MIRTKTQLHTGGAEVWQHVANGGFVQITHEGKPAGELAPVGTSALIRDLRLRLRAAEEEGLLRVNRGSTGRFIAFKG